MEITPCSEDGEKIDDFVDKPEKLVSHTIINIPELML